MGVALARWMTIKIPEVLPDEYRHRVGDARQAAIGLLATTTRRIHRIKAVVAYTIPRDRLHGKDKLMDELNMVEADLRSLGIGLSRAVVETTMCFQVPTDAEAEDGLWRPFEEQVSLPPLR